LKGLVPENRQLVVENGVPLTIQTLPAKSADRLTQLLYLSNMQEEKGIFVFLHAIALLHKKGITDFKANFVGKWESKQTELQFQSLVKALGIEDIVAFLGAKYGDDKHEVLQSANIFVLPTYYRNECFPLSLLEAMQYGLPVVSTNEGAIADIILHEVNGLIAERKSAESLANALEQLLSNPSLREQMGEKSRKIYLERYQTHHFEDRLCSVLTKLTC
jgi:glycosyltransferase involved in cell wall biosynthesis